MIVIGIVISNSNGTSNGNSSSNNNSNSPRPSNYLGMIFFHLSPDDHPGTICWYPVPQQHLVINVYENFGCYIHINKIHLI